MGRLVAASSDPRERLIRAACGDGESWAAIDQAVDAGLIERDGDVLRFTHPLLRSVLYSEMPLDERRQVHQRLGAAAEDIEERAWHLALGADRPSEKIAGMLDGAANHAASRGAPEEAAALTEQATRLTPAGRARGGSRADGARRRLLLPGGRHRPQPGADPVRPPRLPGRPAPRVRCSFGWPRSTTTRAAGRSPSRRSARQPRRRWTTRRCVRTRSRSWPSPGWWPVTSRRCLAWAKASLALGRAGSRPAPGGALAGPRRRLRVPPGPRRAAGPARRRRGARRLSGRGAARAPPDVRPIPGQRTRPQMVRPAGRGAAKAGRPVPAGARPRRRGIAAVPALPLQRARVLGRRTGMPPRNTRWRAAGSPTRAASRR